MKNILKYSALVFFGFLWFLGCSKTTTKFLYEKDILKDDYRYGDLYRLSNLPQFKDPRTECPTKRIAQKVDATLFLAGDSFTEEERINSGNFVSKEYVKAEVAKPNPPLKLVHGKKILVIETVERHLRERFTKVWQNWDIKEVIQEPDQKNFIEKLIDLKIPYVEESHQAALFGFDFILKLKEWKALFNQKVLGKVDEKVTLSSDGKNILYFLDTNPGVSSNFDPIQDQEIELMVENINSTYDYYHKLGFDEVYLSIIPNKTSKYGQGLGEYNHLIERIEKHPKLKMPVISIFEEFQKGDYYLKGDSHWNCAGQQIWVDKINEAVLKVK